MEVIDRSACVVPRRWNVPTPSPRVALGAYGRGHNTCNPGYPSSGPLTGHVPSPLSGGVTGTCALVGLWQLSIGLLNHGAKARTSGFLWVIGMGVTWDKDILGMDPIWALVLQLCSLHFLIHMMFIIGRFINRK